MDLYRQATETDQSPVKLSTAPSSTYPNEFNILSVQHTSTFELHVLEDCQPYSATLEFQVPDPFEVRNEGRPDAGETWSYSDQKLEFDDFQSPHPILMQVVFPERYRGKRLECVSVVDKPSNTVLAKLPVQSVPPLSSMSSVESEE